MKKLKSLGIKLWKDPVWSKIISAGILFIFAIIYAGVKNYTISEGYNLLVEFLHVGIPIYFILSVSALYYLFKLIRKYVKIQDDPIWQEVVGDYTFIELYNILHRQNLLLRTKAMDLQGRQAPNDDLLKLFYMYNSFLNVGVTINSPSDDGGYLYGILCPKFMSYRLVGKQQFISDRTHLIMIRYEITELGRKFYGLLEKSNYKENILNPIKSHMP